jgi:hypothetical protein
MANYVPVSRIAHQRVKVAVCSDLTDYKHKATLPIYGAEISHLSLLAPIVFLETDDRFSLHLLCSISDQFPNIFINSEGDWIGGYLPAIIRQHPFTVLINEAGERILSIDEQSPLVGTTGEVLFEETEPSQYLKNMGEFVNNLNNNGVATRKGIDLLQEYQLIIPWDITIKKADETTISVNGIHRVDEVKLNKLEDEQWLQLKSNGVLSLIYGQLLSMGNMNKLIQLHSNKIETMPITDVEALFADSDADVLNFENI